MNAQHELALKDCRVCNRRRVKCDRRQPTCTKCEKRGLTCSGYGVILKWEQGVASRGNLKGKSLPIRNVAETLPRSSPVSTSKPRESKPERSAGYTYQIDKPSNFEISIIPTPLVSHQLQSSEQRLLLHHYDNIVAPNMAWADCPENPWRHTLIPLALHSPPLLNAILAFAAKHLNAVAYSHSGGSTSIAPARVSDKFQQQAMKLLARDIKQFATTHVSHPASSANDGTSRAHRNALLATMLVLCNVETVWPDSNVWQIHLDAARTVMTTHEILDSTAIYDATSIFLEQELFIANTFASTTNFLNSSSGNAYKFDDPISRPNSIFIEFLKLIEMVTCLERQSLTNPAMLVESAVSSSGLRKLFENARSRTMEIAKRLQVSGSDDYIHLSRTVNCFYHAGLIYSHRALLKDDDDHLDEKQLQLTTSKFELFRALGFTETKKPTFAQDLVWPLFIAGTEARSEDEQAMVVTKLQQAVAETRFSNCLHALEFLKALWQRRGYDEISGSELDWLAFAREWTAQGKTFLVF